MILNPKLEDIQLTSKIGLDTEFNSLDIKNSDCLVISISTEKQDVYVLDCNLYDTSELTTFFLKVSGLEIVVAHNSKVDIGIIYSNFGVLLRNAYCTMLASQVIDNGFDLTINMVGKIPTMDAGPHSLNGVLLRYLGIKNIENQEKKRLQRSFIALKKGTEITHEQLLYAGSDVNYLLDIYTAQQVYIQERNLYPIIKLENRLTPVLIKMEFRGCLIDQERHHENIRNWEITIRQLKKKLDNILVELSKDHPQLYGGKYTNERKFEKVLQLDMFGGEPTEYENENKNNINYSSPLQVAEIFNRLNLPKPTDDEGKVSFGENPINTYINNHPHSPMKAFLEVLLEHREYDKLLGTYGTKLFFAIDKDGRIRTKYEQCWTNTGRLTSSEVIAKELGLNLANIPKRKDVRAIFIPDVGYSFIDSDFTGQEVILAGDYSKEPVLMKAFKEGFDHHSFLASISYSIIFNCKFEVKNENIDVEVDGHTYNLKKLRDEHKSCLFAK